MPMRSRSRISTATPSEAHMAKKRRAGPLSPDPIQADVRARRQVARFGPNPKGFLCDERCPAALLKVAHSWIIEMHHVSGRANDADLKVPLCLICHRKVTAKYATAGVSMDDPETLLHRILAVLLACEVFFDQFGT